MAKKKANPAKPRSGVARTWVVNSNGQEIEVVASDHTILDNGVLMLASGKTTAKAFAPGAWSTLTLKPDIEGG